MKNYLLGLLLLVPTAQISCTGSGAVNPLSPAKASQADPGGTADSDVLYWTSFPVTFGLTDALNGVCLVSKKLGFACGNNGIVLKWDGETWTKVETGFAKNENLLAVSFADENNGWFVGSHGMILAYRNGNWSQEDAQTQEILYSVAATRSRTVWVVGSNGTILTYNGVSWGTIRASDTAGAPTTLTEDLYGLSLSDQNNGWAVGSRGLILKFDGQTWKTYAGSPSTERLNSVSIVNEVQAWIVGAFGTVLSFNGTTWNKMGSAFSGFDLYQVAMRNDSDGWAVGQDDTLIYYDGSRWISHPKMDSKPSINAVAFYKDLGFAVGQNGTILKFEPNGEPAKFSFLFKGEVTGKPEKAKPYWTLTYTLLNESLKASPAMDFEVPLPKGFELYQKKETVTPTPSASSKQPMAPTVTPTPNVPASPSGTQTPGASAANRVSSSLAGSWKMKDGALVWEVGPISASEIKTLTLQLQRKPGEKIESPALFKAVLKSADKVLSEAAPVTLLVLPVAPKGPSFPGVKADPGSKDGGDFDEGDPKLATATPVKGN